MPIDVAAIGCDLLRQPAANICAAEAAAASFMCGALSSIVWTRPFSTCTPQRAVAPDRYEMRPDARRSENWENNYAALLGLGAAVNYALGWSLDAIAQRVTA